MILLDAGLMSFGELQMICIVMIPVMAFCFIKFAGK